MIGPIVLVVAGGVAGWFSGDWAGAVAGAVVGLLVTFGVAGRRGLVGRPGGADAGPGRRRGPWRPGLRGSARCAMRCTAGRCRTGPGEADGEEP